MLDEEYVKADHLSHSTTSPIPAGSRGRSTIISLIIPTRNRLQNLLRLLQSLSLTTQDRDGLEVVLVIDNDDRSYDDLKFEGILTITKVVAPGLTMGELNLAGYNACSGHYIMLLNDDVVVKTKHWDKLATQAFRDFPDEVLLVHVNDKIFESRLCTFPFVTRLFCELAGGICPSEYRRYRIDDHIYNVFNLLSVLGHNRIVYLPEIEFEHLNALEGVSGPDAYQPDPNIHAADTEDFNSNLETRKSLALRLLAVINKFRRQQEEQIGKLLLQPIIDSVSLRIPEYVRTRIASQPLTSANTRVTIGVVTANINSDHAQACLNAVKSYTTNFDLILLDNNRGPKFNHSREMNRLLSICKSDFLILMDDDVIVEPGWINGLLGAVGPDVGVVTPLHKSADGKLSYAGVVMRPDYSGRHTHAFRLFERPFPVQTLCSAIMMVDMNKCGHLRIDESYSKYFLDIDYGLRVWESGFRVVCSPHVIVTHTGGATLEWKSETSSTLVTEQRLHFVRSWVETGRYQALESDPMWQENPEIRSILDFPQRLNSFLMDEADLDSDQALKEAKEFVEEIGLYPAIREWVSERIGAVIDQRIPYFSHPGGRRYAALVGHLEHAVVVEDDYLVNRIFLCQGDYYLVPSVISHFDQARASGGEYRSARTIALLKTLIHGNRGAAHHEVIWHGELRPVLIEENYKGFNLVQYDKIYGLLQAEGEFDNNVVAETGEMYIIIRRGLKSLKRLLRRGLPCASASGAALHSSSTDQPPPETVRSETRSPVSEILRSGSP